MNVLEQRIARRKGWSMKELYLLTQYLRLVNTVDRLPDPTTGKALP